MDPHRPRVTRPPGGAALPLVLAALLGMPAPSAAQSPDDVQAPDCIELPAGWQPEGITAAGSMLYVGSLADGAIYRVDAASGEGGILVPGTKGMVAVGLDYDAAGDRLWVAGGPTGEVRAYAAGSGALLETYTFEAGFLNDVAVTHDGVFVTDSQTPQLVVLPFDEAGGLPAPSSGRGDRAVATTLRLRGDIEWVEKALNANGIVAAPGWLILVQSSTGRLFRVDPASGRSFAIDIGDVDLRAGDGLELAGRRLYVVRNRFDRVAVLDLGPWLASATLRTELTSDDLDTPTTAALVGDVLWAVNARFGTDVSSDTPYWISALPATP